MRCKFLQRWRRTRLTIVGLAPARRFLPMPQKIIFHFFGSVQQSLQAAAGIAAIPQQGGIRREGQAPLGARQPGPMRLIVTSQTRLITVVKLPIFFSKQ
jgi:hypothetical protein